MSVAAMLRRVASARPDAVAMVIDDESITYADLAARSAALADALVGLGVGPGDRVACLVPSCRAVAELLVAASVTGAVFVPLNFRYRGHELRQVLADCRPTVVVVDDDPSLELNRVDLLRSVLDGVDGDFGIEQVVRLTPDDALDGYEALVCRGDPDHAPAPPQPRQHAIAMIYTSGTSAAPKGVLVPEAAFTSRQAAIASRMGLTADDSIFAPLPLFHIAGYIALLASFSVGATYVTNRYFDAATTCAMVERHRCRLIWTGFDTLLRSLIEASEAGAGSLASLEVDALIGPPPALRELEERMGGRCKLLLIYGSTELGSAASLPAPGDDQAARLETSGRPLDGTEFAVMDPTDGRRLAVGEAGELCGRGPAVALGYHGDVSPGSFDADGWFHSGDLGVLLPDGRVQYRSRLKDLIKVGGENVTAAEIEGFLIQHPDVYEVQVVGVPDPAYGEVPVAYVQWAPGRSGDAAGLRSYCEGQLSRVRIPRDFVFLTEDEWPRSSTKIRKTDLRDMYVARSAGHRQEAS